VELLVLEFVLGWRLVMIGVRYDLRFALYL
jgi:hypothetical protein